jgi:hypothetical protein
MSEAARIELITSVAANWNSDCESRVVLFLVSLILSVPALYKRAQSGLLLACKRLRLISQEEQTLPDPIRVRQLCEPLSAWVHEKVAKDFSLPLPPGIEPAVKQQLAVLAHRVELMALLLDTDNVNRKLGMNDKRSACQMLCPCLAASLQGKTRLHHLLHLVRAV